jgi:hypothetical protein
MIAKRWLVLMGEKRHLLSLLLNERTYEQKILVRISFLMERV